VKF
jgi:ribonuclease HI